MKQRFLYRILIFIAIPIAFFVAAEYFMFYQKSFLQESHLEKVYSRQADSYGWVDGFKQKKKIFLMGSSSVRYSLGCTRLNKLFADSVAFFNLAMDARDPIESYFILKKRNLKNVKAVYFGLDPWIYVKRYYMNRNQVLYFDFSPVEAAEYYFNVDNSLYLKKYKYYSKFLIDRKVLLDKQSMVKNMPPDFGSVKLTQKAKNFDGKIVDWFQLEKYGWSDLQFEYLIKMADLCKKRGVEFYAFVPPKRSDYCRSYQNECKDIHQQFVAKLKAFGFDRPILGSFDDLVALGDSSLFVEAFHANAKGQDVYSDFFAKMIKEAKSRSLNNDRDCWIKQNY